MKFLSGGSGFIGQHLMKSLKDDYISIPHQDLDNWKFNDFETFYYLSGYGNHSQQQDIHLTVEANISQLENVLNKVSKLNFKNFIHVSTSSVLLKEQTPYSRTKAWAEEMISWYAQRTGKAFISVRPYSIFGEGEADFRFIPTMVRCLVTKERPKVDPTPSHDWVYVGDFCDALSILSSTVTEYITPQEVGYGYATTNGQVFKDIVKILGLPGKTDYERVKGLRSYDVSRSWYKHKTDYLESIWKAKVGYWEGLKKTVEFYKRKYEKPAS